MSGTRNDLDLVDRHLPLLALDVVERYSVSSLCRRRVRVGRFVRVLTHARTSLPLHSTSPPLSRSVPLGSPARVSGTLLLHDNESVPLASPERVSGTLLRTLPF